MYTWKSVQDSLWSFTSNRNTTEATQEAGQCVSFGGVCSLPLVPQPFPQWGCTLLLKPQHPPSQWAWTQPSYLTEQYGILEQDLCSSSAYILFSLLPWIFKLYFSTRVQKFASHTQGSKSLAFYCYVLCSPPHLSPLRPQWAHEGS